jgi:hypothetical protein
MGGPSDHYGWTSDRFVVRDGSEYMAVEPGWDHIYVTPDWEPFYAIYPVEFRIRQELAAEGRALVHASGADLDGATTLFPAWRGAGKTNTLISPLRAGAEFLSDDRLWVRRDGVAFGYPLSVNLQPYNISSFLELSVQHDSVEDRVRYEVSQYIDATVGSASLPLKAVRYVNNNFVKDDGRSFTTVADLFSGSRYREESTVDKVVVLRAAPNTDHVVVDEMSDDDAVSEVTAISQYEWNGRLKVVLPRVRRALPRRRCSRAVAGRRRDGSGEIPESVRGRRHVSRVDTASERLERERPRRGDSRGRPVAAGSKAGRNRGLSLVERRAESSAPPVRNATTLSP